VNDRGPINVKVITIFPLQLNSRNIVRRLTLDLDHVLFER